MCISSSLAVILTFCSESTVALKDLDFLNNDHKLRLREEDKKAFYSQIDKDVDFFKANSIIDYSLLIGIHYISSSD